MTFYSFFHFKRFSVKDIEYTPCLKKYANIYRSMSVKYKPILVKIGTGINP